MSKIGSANLEAAETHVSPGTELQDEISFPLAIDLDGTLLRTDLLFENIIWFLRTYPLRCLMLVIWALRGRSALKKELAIVARTNIDSMPMNEEFVEYLTAEAANGRSIHLITAADEISAHKAAKRFKFIKQVFASDGTINLKGKIKTQVLGNAFPGGYAYAGDSSADLAVFRYAKSSLLVNPTNAVLRKANAIGNVERVFPKEPLTLRFSAQILRLHQWAKNALIFVPLILGGFVSDPAAWAFCMLGFLAMGIMASSTYLMNDLLDLPDDRRHESKRHRPLASGKLQIKTALILIPVGLISALLLSAIAGPASLGIMFAYLCLTVVYSLSLKKQPIVDVVALAALFTLRLAFGIALAGASVSEWLLVFSMFLFLSLSLAKRHVEVARLTSLGKNKALGRGYQSNDEPILLGFGAASSIAAVFLLVMYLINDAFGNDFYSLPVALWFLPIVLFMWLGQIWLACQREQLDGDPIAHVLKDRSSLAMGGLMGLIILVSWLGGTIL